MTLEGDKMLQRMIFFLLSVICFKLGVIKTYNMRKNLLHSLSYSFVLLSTISLAQPSLNSSNTNPVIGDVFVSKNANYVSPGPAGASQTWNLSSMTSTSTTNYTVVAPASAPNGSSFPSANVAMFDGTNASFYATSASNYLNYGATAGGVVFSYTNAETMCTYPFNFGNSITDAWGCTFVNASMTFYRSGTSTVTADGHGTCITPAGSFSNVMRLHVRQKYKDSTSTFIINYDNDQYLWYKPGNHYPIAIVYSFTTTTFSTPQVSTFGAYLNNVVTDVEDLKNDYSSLKVFPNPTSTVLNIKTDNPVSDKTEFLVCNALGETVKVLNVEELEKSVDVSDLCSGIYFLQIRQEGVLVRNEKIIITK